MQTSANPADWKEDHTEQQYRNSLNPGSAAALKRRLFPLSGRVKENTVYPGLRKGDILQYVRTKNIPSGWPIEVLYFQSNGARVWCSFSAKEIELLRPVEG